MALLIILLCVGLLLSFIGKALSQQWENHISYRTHQKSLKKRKV